MIRIKPFVALFLTTALILTASGCKKDNEPIAEPPIDTTSDNGKHLDISVSFWGIGRAFEKNDEVLQKIEHDFNITLQPVQVSWADYEEKFKVWAASDKFPDLFAHSIINDSPGIYSDWIKQKLIRPLPEDLSQYPNVFEIAQIADTRALRRDKKLYMLPRNAYPTNDLWMLERVVFVRKDWMEQLGYQDPSNFNEFSAMMKAFAKKDPDRNGLHDTVGLAAGSINYLSWVFSPAFPQFAASQWVQEGSQWIPYYASKEMKKIVVQFRKLYTDGGLDTDFFLTKEDDAAEKFTQGKAGALAYKATPDSLSSMVNMWNKYNPGKDFYDSVKILHLWPADDGNRYYYVAPTYWTESYFSAKLDDDKMDRILKLYDYLLSPEGKLLMQYGIEGKDYVNFDGNIVITRPRDEKTEKPVSIQKLYPSTEILRSLAAWGLERSYRLDDLNKLRYGEKNIQASLEEMRWLLNNARATPFIYSIISLSTPNKDKLSAAINPQEDLIKVALSKGDPVKMWQEIVARYNELGLQQAIKEVNEKLLHPD
ncbi:extracellular solute-binding protein [Paenibacillus mendelii]|uniref:Extracellular solute-binding protein n=1 Tax=Paenibacillus mendelii TaxID=206163 RepID=A0ABV6J804_9BACL|nr:extracellular solute-binding protein [Paenibacillus mendelii]MCQ6561333.1 extracellular solute-binding protein [Paenibacillus mendelii]